MSKKANTEMGLTLSTPVSNILELIDSKLKELKRVSEAVYKCPNAMEGFPGNGIQVETKVENLIRAYGSVISREESYQRGFDGLGLKSGPVFKIGGCSAEDWKHDILLRKDVIEYSEELEKLNKLKAKAQEFMTKEEQFELFKKELMNL